MQELQLMFINILNHGVKYNNMSSSPQDFANLDQATGYTPAPAPGVSSIADKIKSWGAAAPVTPTPTQSSPFSVQPSNLLKSNTNTGGINPFQSEEGAGQDIGAGIGGNTMVGTLQKGNTAMSNSDLNNIKTFANIKNQIAAKGGDTSHIDSLLKGYQTQSGQSLSDLFPSLNKSGEQLSGDALGVLLDAVSAGGLETGASSIAEQGSKGVLKGAAIGALKGATTVGLISAGQGVAKSMQANESAKDVAMSGLKSGAVGAVVGGGIGAITGGISGYKNAQAAKISPDELNGIRTNVNNTGSGFNASEETDPEMKATMIKPGTNTLTPEFAQANMKNTVAAMNADHPGLGDEFQTWSKDNGLDLNNVSFNGKTNDITDTANQFLDIKDPSFQKIQDMVSPKLDKNQIKLAISDGRIDPGSDPTLLRGGTPDTVIPSDKTIQVTRTIQSNIPGAADMKPPELFSALNDKGIQIRDTLIPKMEATPVTDDTVQQITNDWEALKAKQSGDIYTSNQIDLPKVQNDFETNYLQKSESGNMNDVWNTTQAYDASVPARVKNATPLSSDLLQSQKEIWLQNRSVLANATHNVSTGLDETSAQAFQNMSDMYNAKENILSKATLNKVSPNLITQWVKSNPWKAGLIGLGIGQVTGANQAVLGGIKSLTGI